MCLVGTPPSTRNASTWPSMNASCDWEANTRCTALPECDNRSVNRWQCTGSPHSRTHTSAKSTSASAPGACICGTMPCTCSCPSLAPAMICGRRFSTVAHYVKKRRPQIIAGARDGHEHVQGMVPQMHAPGAEAEVDFAEVWVRLCGEPVHCHLFTLRLSHSGKAVHRVFASQSQEAFMEGHVEAFRVLGGVPTRHIRYDNLKPAVNKVCFGRSRIESLRWPAFRSHSGFDAFYCIPGIEGAHEKGGVDHEGGRFRRTHLVPVPEVATLAELNERIAEIDR